MGITVIEKTFLINSTNFSDIEWNKTVQVRVSKLVHFPYMRLYLTLAMDTNIHILPHLKSDKVEMLEHLGIQPMPFIIQVNQKMRQKVS